MCDKCIFMYGYMYVYVCQNQIYMQVTLFYCFTCDFMIQALFRLGDC